MNLLLAVAGLLFAFLDVCLAATAIAISVGVIQPPSAVDPPPPSHVRASPLRMILGAAENVAKSQRLQGLVVGLGIGAFAFGVFFLGRALAGEDDDLRIVSPAEGSAVSREISVEVEARPTNEEESLLSARRSQ